MLDLLFLLSFETANKNLLSAPFTVDFGGVNTCLLTIRIKLTSSFPGRQELSDVMTAGFIDLMGKIWSVNTQPEVSMVRKKIPESLKSFAQMNSSSFTDLSEIEMCLSED